MKRSLLQTSRLVLLAMAAFAGCDDDGLTSGDAGYWTEARHQVTATLNDNTLFLIDNGDGTAAVTFDGANPRHVTSDNSVGIGVTTYVGAWDIPQSVTSDEGRSYTITSIGEEAFMGNKSLTSVTLPSSVTSIGQGAFTMCTNLTSVNIPEGVTEIPSACFGACTKMATLTLPPSVNVIGRAALWRCSKLASLHVGAVTPPALSDSLVRISYAADFTVYVPESSVAAYQQADFWNAHTIVGE